MRVEKSQGVSWASKKITWGILGVFCARKLLLSWFRAPEKNARMPESSLRTYMGWNELIFVLVSKKIHGDKRRVLRKRRQLI